MKVKHTFIIYYLWVNDFITTIICGDSLTFYEYPGFKGKRYTIPVNRCENTPPDFHDMASTVTTKTCAVLYSDPCCQGKAVRIQKQENIWSNGVMHDFAVFSVSPCGSYRAEFPKEINETWSGHNDTMSKVIEYQDIAVYQDGRVLSSPEIWQADFISQLWGYTKATYGNFGPEDSPLLLFLHDSTGTNVISPRKGLVVKPQDETSEAKMNSSRNLNYFEAESKCRNVIDIVMTPDVGEGMDDICKKVAGMIEWAAKGVWNNPNSRIWETPNSPWAEIFTYDAYLQMNLQDDAKRVFDTFSSISRSYPREDSFWFKDWFYPIYQNYGGARVLNNYFELLSRHFLRATKQGKDWSYERPLNNGEFVHFFSGAAAFDLQEQYEVAFDWNSDTDLELMKAKTDFPAIKYD